MPFYSSADENEYIHEAHIVISVPETLGSQIKSDYNHLKEYYN